MLKQRITLAVDCGEVGYVGHRQRFKVVLDASQLSMLISDATNAYRIYELLLINRPGDVWKYVHVVTESLPDGVIQRLQFAKSKANHQQAASYWDNDNVVPFAEFDGLFFWSWDDTTPEDEAWLNRRSSGEFKSFALQLFNEVQDAQKSLEFGDELISHVIKQVKEYRHTYDYLDRDSAIAKSIMAKSRKYPDISNIQSAFHEKLQQLLRDESIASVACRGGGYHTIRLMALEQRRRANLTGHKPEDALELNALLNIPVANNEWWDSMINFYDEGLGHGDLYINVLDDMGANIKELVEQHKQVHSRYILCSTNEGEIVGYDKLVGVGWVLYSKQVSSR